MQEGKKLRLIYATLLILADFNCFSKLVKHLEFAVIKKVVHEKLLPKAKQPQQLNTAYNSMFFTCLQNDKK